jgi:hypothetical protein
VIDNFNEAAFWMLVDMRGGLPECCDFCGQPFSEARFPVPEEGQAWSCSECEKQQ